MKNKKLVITIAVIVVLVAALLAVYAATRPAAAAGGKTITVTVVHADGTSKDFTYQTDAEYLGEVLVAEGLVEGEDSEYGRYITRVDGEDAIYEENGSYWALYEGDAYANQSADQTPLTDGGTYSLVYTTD